MSLTCDHPIKTDELSNHDYTLDYHQYPEITYLATDEDSLEKIDSTQVPIIVTVIDENDSSESLCDLCKLRVIEDWIKNQDEDDCKFFEIDSFENMLVYLLKDEPNDNTWVVVCRYNYIGRLFKTNDEHRFRTLLKLALRLSLQKYQREDYQ